MLMVPRAGADGLGFLGLAVVWEGVNPDQSFSCGRGFPPVAISCGLSVVQRELVSCHSSTLGWVRNSARPVCSRGCNP